MKMTYELEYGTDALEIHMDAVQPVKESPLSTTYWQQAGQYCP
jgi:hypothetical protein